MKPLKLPSLNWIILSQIVLLAALFINLGKPALYNEEQRRALIALEMDYQDNLLVPTELGEYYYKKPPLYNWLLIGSFKIFGEASEFAVRFFGALSHWIIGILIFLFARKDIGDARAFLASCFWWVSVDLLFYFSMFGEIDLVYSLLTFAAMMLLFRYGERKQFFLMFLLAYGLHALGFLTKGLPSIVFAGVTTLAYLYSSKQWNLLWSWQHFFGMAVFLLITGAYFLAYSQFNSPLGFVEDLWGQSADRTATQYGIAEFLLHLIKFPLISFKDILPGSLFIIFLLPKRVRSSVWKHPFLRFCLIAGFANLFIYWISPGTRSRYLYMMYPLFLLIIAWGFGEAKSMLKDRELQLRQFLSGLLFLSGIVLLGLPIYAITSSEGLSGTWWFCIPFGLIMLSLSVICFKQGSIWIFLLGFLITRLWFDIGILPIRAASGQHEEVKENALKIAEITKGQHLNLYQFKNEGWFSLAMAFYLTREKQQVIGLEYEANCEDYFIGFDHEFTGQEVSVHYEFNWRDFHYYLVTFEHCP